MRPADRRSDRAEPFAEVVKHKTGVWAPDFGVWTPVLEPFCTPFALDLVSGRVQIGCEMQICLLWGQKGRVDGPDDVLGFWLWFGCKCA